MSVQGLCQICENATAEHTCSQCGTAVCSDHYEEGLGLCVTCAQGGTQVDATGDTGPPDVDDEDSDPTDDDPQLMDEPGPSDDDPDADDPSVDHDPDADNSDADSDDAAAGNDTDGDTDAEPPE